MPAASVPSQPLAPATAEKPGADDGEPRCEMAVAVPPRMLSAEWPTMIGKRVSFVSRIERNLGSASRSLSQTGWGPTS